MPISDVIFRFNISDMSGYLSWHDHNYHTKTPYDLPPGELTFEKWLFWYYACHHTAFAKGKNIDIEIPFKFLSPNDKAHKKISFVRCPKCNTVFIRVSRRFKFCPKCAIIIKRHLQRIWRGTRICERIGCGKPLPKEYPNRKYCTGACRTASCRERKKIIVSPD